MSKSDLTSKSVDRVTLKKSLENFVRNCCETVLLTKLINCMRPKFYIYIVSNRSKMIYIGLTHDLKNILKKHRALRMNCTKGNFGLTKLVHVEEYHDVNQAIRREEELKNAPRSFKAKLLSYSNPSWECIQTYWKENLERAVVK